MTTQATRMVLWNHRDRKRDETGLDEPPYWECMSLNIGLEGTEWPSSQTHMNCRTIVGDTKVSVVTGG